MGSGSGSLRLHGQAADLMQAAEGDELAARRHHGARVAVDAGYGRVDGRRRGRAGGRRCCLRQCVVGPGGRRRAADAVL